MQKLINILSNNSEKSKIVEKNLISKLNSLDFTIPKEFDENAQLSICIGGDGSFLNAVRNYNFPKMPFVGINTGHLGFFQEVYPYNIDTFLDLYLKKEYYIQKINPVEASICTRTHCVNAIGINEIVIKGDKSRTIHMNISVNDKMIQNFSGDGIIISTPSGSTAYNYSSGGSIVDPSIKVLQITPLSPINTNAYRSFTSSVILPYDSKIKIYPEYRFENSILVSADGIEHKHQEIVKIEITTSQMDINLLRFKDYDFWTKVSEKFL